MRSLGCFWCPKRDYTARDLNDPCPECGRTYASPLTRPPTHIGKFRIIEPIARGFYGATYRAEQASLKRTVVLKVVPTAVYQCHTKDWQAECESHSAVSANNPFVADITDNFDDTVAFGEGALECHVAVLTNLPGSTLERVLSNPQAEGLSPRMAMQIAADLFGILAAFSAREQFHNDLHADNILVHRLQISAKRAADAFDPMIVAVAIDLGSMRDESTSGLGERINDQHQVARHLVRLADSVRTAHATLNDAEYRIVEALRGLAEHLTPASGGQRLMSSDDAQGALRGAMQTVDEPWRQPLTLRRMGDAYNAQVIESWHVPELWLDPEGRWFARTTGRGPQVITGMRGCGKTMLLRALHFHARARKVAMDVPPTDVIASLRADGFVGLFASGQRLLNPRDASNPTSVIPSPFERLYIAYTRDAIQVLRHLRSLDPTALNGTIEHVLREALRVLEFESPVTLESTQAFDQVLWELQLGLADQTLVCRLRTSPAEAFGHLAAIIRSASPVFADAQVLFLLDDVSSRYLPVPMVQEVISSLLFQQPSCSFRITTEAQALHRALLSPGGIVAADPSRDYEEVDLGNEVYRLLQEGTIPERVEFVASILARRSRQLRDEWSALTPQDVLGKVFLIDIADEIVNSSDTSAQRKEVYRGIHALLAVCVGDLGDVVKLYEKIIQRGNPRELPVPAKIQTNCFLEHSAGLLHVLNRRQQRHKDLAIAFAQASHELMQLSANASGNRGPRQYTKLYVRVEPGPESARTVERIFDLLDAGVFVYDGGAPRSKTRDDDPVLQFKLSYRKMLGLQSFIGISDRDRFELSGEKLRRFLFEPESSKSVLLESEARTAARKRAETMDADLDGRGTDTQRSEEATAGKPQTRARGSRAGVGAATQLTQLTFFETAITPNVSEVEPVIASVAPRIALTATSHALESWTGTAPDALIVALGFEERARVSVERVLATIRPRRIIAVRYTPDDQGHSIALQCAAQGVPVIEVGTMEDLTTACQEVGPDTVIDSTGLSKAFLFCATRVILAARQRVRIVHTLAAQHYPRNEDLLRIGVTADDVITGETFSKLEQLLTGEEAPYTLVRVHSETSEPERNRALIASASPKNDRLFHLLDERSFEAARILVPQPTSSRRRVARAAAELAASIAESNTLLVDTDTNDLREALRQCVTLYRELYFDLGMNVELGLTGSKMHAVACAAMAAAGRVSYAWYVVPARYDAQRFTVGVAETQCFEVRWDDDQGAHRPFTP